jgi:hypothetical protein
MRARAFFRSGKLMPPGAVIGALFQANGFYDFTKWQLCIDDEGNLFQWIQDSPNETRQEQVFLGQDAVLQLVLLFEELGFTQFPDQLPAPPPSGFSDDYISISVLVLRWNGAEKYVIAPVDSPHPDQHKFQVLWDAVHAHVPKQA